MYSYKRGWLPEPVQNQVDEPSESVIVNALSVLLLVADMYILYLLFWLVF